jgi:hypothetical protein
MATGMSGLYIYLEATYKKEFNTDLTHGSFLLISSKLLIAFLESYFGQFYLGKELL